VEGELMGFYAQIELGFMNGAAPSHIAERLGLDEDQAVGKVARAWGWSIEAAAPDGVVRGEGAVRAIERAVGWAGPRGKLVEAFISAGVLEMHPEGPRFRGWVERYGSIHDQARTDRAQHAAHVRWGKVVAGCAACIAQSNAPSMPGASSGASGEQSPEQCPEDARSRPRSRSKIQNLDSKPPPTPSAPDGAKGEAAAVGKLVRGVMPDWATSAEGRWERVQDWRGRKGLGREEPLQGKAWRDFETGSARVIADAGPDAFDEIVSGFLRDPRIRTPQWPTRVLNKAWVVRLEGWLLEEREHLARGEHGLGGPAPPELPDTPAGNRWAEILEEVRVDGKPYAASWLERLTPIAFDAGVMVLRAPDAFFRDWVERHYANYLREGPLPEGWRVVVGEEAAA
jgi:hypothetical protein